MAGAQRGDAGGEGRGEGSEVVSDIGEAKRAYLEESITLVRERLEAAKAKSSDPAKFMDSFYDDEIRKLELRD